MELANTAEDASLLQEMGMMVNVTQFDLIQTAESIGISLPPVASLVVSHQ